jgi:large subunit ribosomal protein L15
MNLIDVLKTPSDRKKRKRVGRGVGSGLGKTSGRGHKGQKSRSGYSRRLGHEGGQMPLIRRIPKRGFNNKRFSVERSAVNVSVLEQQFNDGDEVNVDVLLARGLVRKQEAKFGLKILGNGNLSKKLTVKANAFSAAAKEKIEAAGGVAEVIS